MRIHAVLPAVLLPLLMASSSAHAADPKACDLLNAQTASALLGGPVKPPIDMQGIGCSYSAASGSATASLMVVDAAGLTADQVKRSLSTQPGTTQIQGLGDAGFLTVGYADRNTLTVLYHRKTLQFGVQKKMTPDLQTQMIQAMKQMLGKI